MEIAPHDDDAGDLVHQFRPLPPGAAPVAGPRAGGAGGPLDRLRDGRERAALSVDLGMPRDRIVLGYNAVDNDRYARDARAARDAPGGRRGLPEGPYFLAVNRFVPEKNLIMLIGAFARYRAGAAASAGRAWDLVL